MNIITQIRKSYITKGVAVLLAFNMVGEFIWPTAAMALTSGPSQPETLSFEPIETTDMVNLFTGDFTYNIPLMNVPGPNGGYPINLAYHAGTGMDEEASWVGLGWNINAGAINRQVRGLPDDFDGDKVVQNTSIKDNYTVGLGVSPSIEIFGADESEGNSDPESFFNLGLNFRCNSYRGFGYSLDPSISLGSGDFTYDIGLSLDSEDGVGVNAKVSFKQIKNGMGKKKNRPYNVTSFFGVGFNSKRGLDISSGRTVSKRLFKETTTVTDIKTGQMLSSNESWIDQNERTFFAIDGGSYISSTITALQDLSASSGSGISFAESAVSQTSSLPMNTYRLNVSLGAGPGFNGLYKKARLSGNFDVQRLLNKGKDVDFKAYGYENMHDDVTSKYLLTDYSRSNEGDVRKTSSNLAIPQITHDIYSVLGQGIGGSFRPYRSEVGRIYDPLEISMIFGGYFNGELGGSDHSGWGAGATSGYSEQQAWDRHHEEDDEFNFSKPKDLWERAGEDGYPIDNYTEEDVYYKVTGEKAVLEANGLDHIGGESAISGEIKSTGTVWNYGVELDETLKNKPEVYKRAKRNNLVTKLTNKEINGFHPADFDPTTFRSLDDMTSIYNQNDFFSELEIFHYKWGTAGDKYDPTVAPENYLVRNAEGVNYRAEHHTGAYKVLDASGSHYVYGLPIYNKEKVEKVFTVNAAEDNGDGVTPIFKNKSPIVPFDYDDDSGDVVFKHNNTDKFYSKKETPAYAYSYLLTSILGADFIDTDGNGPDDGDRGYWAKMDYVQYTDDYKWRAPYEGCMYSMGDPSSLDDDMGSYQYGVKEVWYLARIETETHIAIFEMSERNDNKEAHGEFTNKGSGLIGGESGLKLDKIKLYEKRSYFNDPANAVPIQTVHFDYSYELCPNVLNNVVADQGKLTLKKVWFTYEGNTRGALNPYEFSYSASNPSYSVANYDRWGNYKPTTGGSDELNQILPYTHQYYQGANDGGLDLTESAQAEIQALADQNAEAWSLIKIDLPSGGTINVDYESDDYAYVQDQRATQMTYISAINDDTPDNELYRDEVIPLDVRENDFSDPNQRRIYFKLEKPLPTSLGLGACNQAVFSDYVEDLIKDEDGKRNLYFKSYVNLKGDAWDFVSGYLPLEGSSSFHGVSTSAEDIKMIDSEECYTQGYVTVECAKKKNGSCFTDYHPMALAAWQYIRSSAPQILVDGGSSFDSDEMASLDSDTKKAKKVKNLLGFIPELSKMFTGYRRHCFRKELAKTIDLNKSMIRLTSPDKKKFGGGVRVKQIELTDNWSIYEGGTEVETPETYGLSYEYTQTEEINGTEVEVSSGVAQYEPIIGGDENALKYPKYYPGKLPFHTDNNLFFENPVNEDYMPAPIVGYSQVNVASINTRSQMKKASEGTLAPEENGRSATGVKVYEFYTAKDFPVHADDTDLGTESNTIKNFNVPIFIPFVATYKRNKIAATQGYVIELNDMHGKLRSTVLYGLDENYDLLSDPISKTTYKYSSFGDRLDNKVPVLRKDPVTGDFITEEAFVGVESEFFTDQRHNKTASTTFGFNGNMDFVWVPVVGKIPLPTFWGTITSDKNDVRTLVTNKIIRKSGILVEVENENEGYISRIRNVKYDAESGRALLTVTNNEFNDPVYNFSQPAHWEYDGMAGAYQNINVEFKADLTRISGGDLYSTTIPEAALARLVPGDEMIARVRASGGAEFTNRKATFITKNYGSGSANAIIHISKMGKVLEIDNVEGFFKVYRSGHRNHFLTDIGNIMAMIDPTDNAVITESINEYNPITGEPEVSSESVTIKKKILPHKVVSAGAVVYKDNWEEEIAGTENPYSTGQAGVWRPYKSYAYVGDRSQSTDEATDEKKPNVKDDGLMSNVTLFNWQVFDFERFDKNWQWGSEITRMNQFGYETENKDRLGIYSAALFGYNNAFAIAVGSNAEYTELGTQDFEMYDPTNFSSSEGEIIEREGNLYFHGDITDTDNRVVTHLDNYKIIGGKIGAENYIIVDRLFDAGYWSGTSIIELAITTSNNSGQQVKRMFTASIVGASAAPAAMGGAAHTKLLVDWDHSTITAAGISYLPATTHLGGVATVYRTISVDNIMGSGNPSVSISNDAHTGRQSMRIDGTSVGFTHGKLQLKSAKRYVLSYWVKREGGMPTHDYNLENAVQVHPAGTFDDLVVPGTEKSGRIINGWQKVEVEFELEPMTYLYGGAIETRFYTNGAPLLIDDIRISPKTGGIVTSVYDPDNYRLRASLNANNYATFYFYDEQGNLYLTKQETEEGIVTISESHGHSKPSVTE